MAGIPPYMLRYCGLVFPDTIREVVHETRMAVNHAVLLGPLGVGEGMPDRDGNADDHAELRCTQDTIGMGKHALVL